MSKTDLEFRLPWAEAHALALQLADSMRPYVERVEIAGSLRRRKPDVGDLELVAIPKLRAEAVPASLFGDEPLRTNVLYAEWQPPLGLQWVKGHAAAGKFWQGQFMHDGRPVKLDLWLTTPEQWGLIFLLRTGSDKWNRAVVSHAGRRGTPSDGGWFHNHAKQRVSTPEEMDVFRFLRLAWVDPEHRTGPEALRGCDYDAEPDAAGGLCEPGSFSPMGEKLHSANKPEVGHAA